MLNVLFLLISLIPSFFFVFWLRKLKKEDPVYSGLCTRAFVSGIVCSIIVILVSLIFQIIENILKIRDNYPVAGEIFHNFIVLAFSEELVKFLTMKHIMKKREYAYNQLVIAALMMLVGLGFGVLEDIPYMFGASPVMILIRGLTIMHGGYGFIMGWFYGKAVETGKKGYAAAGFAIPLFLHGLYDTCLSEKLNAINDNIGVVSLALAVFAVVTVVLAIVYFSKRREK